MQAGRQIKIVMVSSHDTLCTWGLLLTLAAVLCGLACRKWRQETLNQTLMQAISRDDVRTALATLNAGADPNSRYAPSLRRRFDDWIDDYPFGEPLDTTALVEAAGHSNRKIVQALLEHGADVTVRCRYQAPNLEGEDTGHYTALQVANPHDKSIVRLLREAGANE